MKTTRRKKRLEAVDEDFEPEKNDTVFSLGLLHDKTTP